MTTIVTRASKGAPLTYTELDANFDNLNNDKVEDVNPATSGTLTHSGDILLSGSGKRFTADFSSSLYSNRMAFQTSVADGNTILTTIPNGLGDTSGITICNGDDVSATSTKSYLQLLSRTTEAQIITSRWSTNGAYLPMTFIVGGAERLRIAADGNVLVTSPAGLGYGAGAGGTVTQATNKGTAVTLHKTTGQITTSSSALSAGAFADFQVTNTAVSPLDVIIYAYVSGGTSGAYRIETRQVSSGFFIVRLTNTSGVSLSESITINFAIIKGAAS